MIKKPLLSVITPVYNGVNFIAGCYNNLISQSFQDWEWIVVDDGSTDGTEDAVKKINDDRIHLFSYKPNRGRGFARTLALNESRGEWVVVWDVDDIHFTDRLEEINKARLDGNDYFCSYAVVVDNRLNIKGIRGFIKPSNGLPRGFVHPTMACRTDIAKEIGYKSNIGTGEDAKILWVLSAKYKGLWFDDALTIYYEDREVNLKKAIASNVGHLVQIKEMFREASTISVNDYIILYIKYRFKLVVLNCMRIYPSFYLRLLKYRDYGEIKTDWTLSENRMSFISELKNSCK